MYAYASIAAVITTLALGCGWRRDRRHGRRHAHHARRSRRVKAQLSKWNAALRDPARRPDELIGGGVARGQGPRLAVDAPKREVAKVTAPTDEEIGQVYEANKQQSGDARSGEGPDRRVPEGAAGGQVQTAYPSSCAKYRSVWR
jgi:hypothetical protein